MDSQRRVWAGKRGDSELTEVPNPPETQARYRVEEQFTNAIRGTEIVDMVAFETGVHYMEWTEAVGQQRHDGPGGLSAPLISHRRGLSSSAQWVHVAEGHLTRDALGIRRRDVARRSQTARSFYGFQTQSRDQGVLSRF